MKNSSREQHPQINREQDGSGVADPQSSFRFRAWGSPHQRAQQRHEERNPTHRWKPLELHTALL